MPFRITKNSLAGNLSAAPWHYAKNSKPADIWAALQPEYENAESFSGSVARNSFASHDYCFSLKWEIAFLNSREVCITRLRGGDHGRLCESGMEENLHPA